MVLLGYAMIGRNEWLINIWKLGQKVRHKNHQVIQHREEEKKKLIEKSEIGPKQN